MQVTSISQSTAKQMANWGKIYDVTYNSVAAIAIPPAIDDVRGYLQTYIEMVRTDAINHVNADGIYTIVFPVRDYIIKTYIKEDHLKLDISSLMPHLSGVQFNFIGIKIGFQNNGELAALSQAAQINLINTNLVSTGIQQNNINSPNYLASVNPTTMPKWIWKPMNNGDKANSQLFCLFNSITLGVIDNNSVNFMGIEVQGEAYNQWSNLIPHPYMNTTGNMYSVIKAFMWDNLYIDNNHFHDHYGQGLFIAYIPYGNPNYVDCYYQNHTMEINNNIIRNIYGFNPAPPSPFVIYDDGGDGIGITGVRGAVIEKNIVYNDMAMTGMCGRLGIGGESFGDCVIKKKMFYGYKRIFFF